MGDSILNERKVALEEAFFAKQNNALLGRLRDADNARLKKQALSTASGITDDAVLEKLAALNISGDTLAALALVPLVVVAWADGSLDDKERRAAFSKAAEMGLQPQDVSHQLFERWLAEKPPAALVNAWKDYISAFAATMSADARRAFKQQILARARDVAGAAGGFLGTGRKVSAAEESALKDMERAIPD